MKVLMMTDLEGVAGVVTFEQDSYSDGKYYETAKRLLTAEVNAAVDGLMAAGAEEVLVIDGHGPGGIWFEDLHPRAKRCTGAPLRFRPFGSRCTNSMMSPSSSDSTRWQAWLTVTLRTPRAAAPSTVTH